MKQPKAEAARWLAQAHSDLGFAALGAREGYHAQACFMAQQLDQFYVPTRYPNGLPGGVPAQVFSRTQADGALDAARRFVEAAEALAG